ncbi:MAG: DUF554 domain-containing protein [Clostridia bacterium]|nr:DUF554 domain-containing protein [Clostridia bacterium]
MIGLGTLINTAGVAAGGFIGLFLRKGIKPGLQDGLMKACGIASLFIGAAGTMCGMLKFENNAFTTKGSMLLIFSLVIGTFIGELLKIEQSMDNIGNAIKKLIHHENDSKFSEGFVGASLIMCVGAMTIVGAVQDGINGDISMLAAKSVLDFIMAIVLASTYGPGVIFSAATIFIYQGALTLGAYFAGSFMSDMLIANLSYIGSALIFCVGVNLTFGKKVAIGNMLPALLIPCFYSLIF